MKRASFEKSVVVVLFILVLVMFSFAEKDSKKIVHLYTKTTAETSATKDFTAEFFWKPSFKTAIAEN
jgi:hypothetical protein